MTEEMVTERICPRCQKKNPEESLKANDYCCPGCGLVQVHWDTTPTGAVLGIRAWLRAPGEILESGPHRYQVVKLLGKGGFGATYLVEDLSLYKKQWAMKEIPEFLCDPSEVELLARIEHGNIPQITASFVLDGMRYLVQQYGGDKTLDEVRKTMGGRVSWRQTVPWVRQICDALIYLHAQNPPVVHRDLKPTNLLLRDDKVMLIDFGIAKAAKPGEETRVSARAITDGFSPPEQALGTGTDPRSDIYALAATLYALWTGVVPPKADRLLINKEQITPPSALVQDLPRSLEALILDSLRSNPEERPKSVKQFLERFEEAVREPRTEARTQMLPQEDRGKTKLLSGPSPAQKKDATLEKKGKKAKLTLALGGGVVVLLASMGAWMMFGNKDNKDNTPVTPSNTDVLSLPNLPVSSPPGPVSPQPAQQVKPVASAPQGSAMDEFVKNRKASIEPLLPQGPEAPRAEPRPKPRPKKIVRSSDYENNPPSAPVKPKPNWGNFIDEGTRHTD